MPQHQLEYLLKNNKIIEKSCVMKDLTKHISKCE